MHNAEFHKNDQPTKKKHKLRHQEISDDGSSISGYSTSNDDFSDEELSTKFKEDVKDVTEDELVSSDDEFNEAWEREHLPEPRRVIDGPGEAQEVQTYERGEWEWMETHHLFSPCVVLHDSLNIAIRRNKQQETDVDDDIDDRNITDEDIESILGPDSNDEDTNESTDGPNLHKKEPSCDNQVCNNYVNDVNNVHQYEDDDDECIELISVPTAAADDTYDDSHNILKNFFPCNPENLEILVNDEKFACFVLLDDFMKNNSLEKLKQEHSLNFDFSFLSHYNNDNNRVENTHGEIESYIYISSSDDDLDDNETLPSDYDDYSDDACYIVDEIDDSNPETILPHALEPCDNDVIEIDD